MKLSKQKLIVATLAAGLMSATQMAQAVPFAIGDIFASIGAGQTEHRNAAGTLLDTFNNTTGGFTTGSAVSSAGDLYVTDFSSNTVSVYDGPGDPHTRTTFGGGYSTPESIVFAGNGNVLVGSVGGGIREFDSAGTFIKTIVAGTRVDFFDLAADQDTILFGQEGNRILTASRSTLAQGTPFTAAGSTVQAFAMRILADGTVLLADRDNVKRFSSTGSALETYDITGDNGFFGLNLDPDGTTFLSSSFQTGSIYRFNIGAGGVDTHTQTINTGVGGSRLFGVSVFGEITVGNPPPPPSVPEPMTLGLVGLGLTGLIASRRRKTA